MCLCRLQTCTAELMLLIMKEINLHSTSVACNACWIQILRYSLQAANQQKEKLETPIIQQKGSGRSLSDNCKTTLVHGKARTRNDPLLHCGPTNQAARAVNHALVKQSYFIHQTWFPVSLELKDTEVRAYRTDPVQVRSCHLFFSFAY